MEQERNQNQNQPQQPQTPLKCPRCNSINTKFRYFNNHCLSQPRHYCRDCKRQWTVGGSLRDIPVGGTTRNKQTKAPFSKCGCSSSQPQPPKLASGVAMATTFPQPLTNFQEPIAPLNSFYFDNEFANLDAIDLLIQPEVMNQVVNVENQVGFGSADMNLLQDWNVQSLASEQAFPQQIQGYNGQSNEDPGTVELYQCHDQAVGSYQLPNDLVQPTWPMEFAPQEAINGFSFSTADACLWDNFSGSTTNMDLPSTSVDPTQWPEFPGYGPP